MDTRERLAALARIGDAPAPVVSVYLDTRWADEQQRERVRLFLKNAVRRAAGSAALHADLEWIEAQGRRLVDQVEFPDADGVALFACAALDLREVLPVRAPFEPTFAVGDRPHLAPLADVIDRTPRALVVFVDGECARLLTSDTAGAADEATLEHDVPGRHARGGWAGLAQSRYQRHIEGHRDQHFEAVAHAVDAAVLERDIEHIVLAGEVRAVARLRQHLPERAAALVAATMPAARHDTAAALRDRAAEPLAAFARERESAAVAAVLTEAAKGGRAAVGVADVLGAVARRAVLRLYILKGFARLGAACTGCEALIEVATATCRACGAALHATELGDALVARVLAARGAVEIVADHAGLAAVDGIAASLRFPL